MNTCCVCERLLLNEPCCNVNPVCSGCTVKSLTAENDALRNRNKVLVEAGDELESHYPMDAWCNDGKLAAKKAWREAKQAPEAAQ